MSARLGNPARGADLASPAVLLRWTEFYEQRSWGKCRRILPVS